MEEAVVGSALQKVNTLQRSILDSSDLTIISTDLHGGIQTINATALQKLGYEPGEVNGQLVSRIIHDPQEIEQRAFILSQELGYSIKPNFEAIVAKARLGIADENIWTYIRKDCSRFPVRLSVTVIRDEAEQLFGFLAIGKEITLKQRAEPSLFESGAGFLGAFQHAAIGMALISPQGHWLKVNTSVCDIVGYSESELLALTFQDITHPDDLELDLNYVKQMLLGEIDTYQMEKRYIHKQGHEVWILLSVSLVCQEDGQPLYFISQIQDINARKLSEQKLSESLAEKNVMLQEIHHRVKNNLQVICSLLIL